VGLSCHLHSAAIEAQVIVETCEVAPAGDFVDEHVYVKLLSRRHRNAEVQRAQGSVGRAAVIDERIGIIIGTVGALAAGLGGAAGWATVINQAVAVVVGVVAALRAALGRANNVPCGSDVDAHNGCR
jgi:hypothetical protein